MKGWGGLHDIPVTFSKFCDSYVAHHITFLFNLCVFFGTFPESFKKSRITPIFKKGSQSDIKNYRPICILSNLNKNFESLIHKRLTSYLHSQSLLSENQFGFRKKMNTEQAALTLINRALPALQKKSLCSP